MAFKGANYRIAVSEPVRVMHLRSSPFLGSPEKLILGRLRKLRPEECEYVVGIFDEQTGRGNDFSLSLKEVNANYFLLRDSMVYFIANLFRIRKKIREFNSQIVCTHDYKSNFYGFVLKKWIGIPVLSTYHGLTRTDFKIKLYQMIDRVILKGFDGIVCVSKETKEKLRGWIPSRSLHVITNAVDIKKITQLSAAGAHHMDLSINGNHYRTVVFAGRLSKEKGLLYLIQAAEIVLARHDNVRFLILGDGPEKAHAGGMISEKGLGKSIHLLGFKKNVYPYLRSAEFLVLPSLTEGMPVVILESFALRKPVIATNVGGIPEVVQNGFNGILVNPKDVNALAQAMESLVVNPQQASEMGQNGYDLVKANHNFELQVKRYLFAYKTLLTNNVT